MQNSVKQYLLVTCNYWFFTLSDGALRMLILLYFHQLGYNALALASLFIFYEFFGVITNLLGGWLASRWGLNRTMNIGLSLQLVALAMLLVPSNWLIVPWVMAAQALSGIAKDLNKMSAKSSVKLLAKEANLFKWVAILTGSKNTLKGAGFFVGALLLSLLGFKGAIASMLVVLLVITILSFILLQQDLGKASKKTKFKHLLSKSPAINWLSAARLFLFASRDVWFVVALPVYMASVLGWDFSFIGAFMASWVIIYGLVQASAPRFFKQNTKLSMASIVWLIALAATPIFIVMGSYLGLSNVAVIIIGLALFGILFAVNSSLHSYLILTLASNDDVATDVGFYYMANAAGRLLGTLLSGWVYMAAGLNACLIASTVMILLASALTFGLHQHQKTTA